MNYSVDPILFEKHPDLQFGILVARGLDNRSQRPMITKLLESAQAQTVIDLEAVPVREWPVVAGLRAVMMAEGINPNKYPPSVEAMLKCVGKGAVLPTINGLVDLCNAVSVQHKIPLGGHDLAAMESDLRVGYAMGTEVFLPFGSADIETVDVDELIFASGEGVQTRKWIWRQSETGKMTSETTDVFFQLVGYKVGACNALENALDDLEGVLKAEFGVRVQRFLVTKEFSTISF